MNDDNWDIPIQEINPCYIFNILIWGQEDEKLSYVFIYHVSSQNSIQSRREWSLTQYPSPGPYWFVVLGKFLRFLDLDFFQYKHRITPTLT